MIFKKVDNIFYFVLFMCITDISYLYIFFAQIWIFMINKSDFRLYSYNTLKSIFSLDKLN